MGLIEDLAAATGGKVENVSEPLPDGSGFAVVSYPLPKDHWSLNRPLDLEPPAPFLMDPADSRRNDVAQAIREAGKYAYHAACLSDPDHDPDAFLQNLIVGLIGYWGVPTKEEHNG